MRRIPQYVPLKKAEINRRSKARAERYARLFGEIPQVEGDEVSQPPTPSVAPYRGTPLAEVSPA